jgi:hypothetical protein
LDIIHATETMIGARPSINSTICTNVHLVEARTTIVKSTKVSPAMAVEKTSASNTTRTKILTTTTTIITASEKQVSLHKSTMDLTNNLQQFRKNDKDGLIVDGATIKRYHAYNGLFRTKLSVKSVALTVSPRC